MTMEVINPILKRFIHSEAGRLALNDVLAARSKDNSDTQQINVIFDSRLQAR